MKQIWKLRKFLFLCVLLLFFSLFLFGCKAGKKVENHTGININKWVEKDALPQTFSNIGIISPLQIEQGQFNTVNGWLNNETILYITNVGLGSNLFSYNLFTGETALIFESEAPIATVLANPSRTRILIQTAPTTYEGEITIIDSEGKEMMRKRLEAFDFVFKWNPYEENELLISLFSENWDFSTIKINVKENAVTDISIKEPFAYWIRDNELVYLNWSDESTTLLAPLMKMSIPQENEKIIMDNIYHVETIKDLLMTITVSSENREEAVYSFLTNNLSEQSSFSMPHLSRFSGWVVPFFDFDQHNHFFTFKPLYATDADTYSEAFSFISYNIEKGEEEVILEDMKNEPLSCSPNGKLCLYGYYLEKLIDIGTRQIFQLQR